MPITPSYVPIYAGYREFHVNDLSPYIKAYGWDTIEISIVSSITQEEFDHTFWNLDDPDQNSMLEIQDVHLEPSPSSAFANTIVITAKLLDESFSTIRLTSSLILFQPGASNSVNPYSSLQDFQSASLGINGSASNPFANIKIRTYTSTDIVEYSNDVQSYPVRISALPFRAYESIYNSFYRDQRNNPIVRNGELQPNEYLPTVEGGPDNTIYDFHYRNWEQDQFTTAMTSPQQGVAPLVGISSTGVATYQDEDGTQYKVQLTTADDNDTITGASYTSNIPNSVARSIVNIASSGISINDLRAVNSLQRWLETNMRRGLKYKDQIASHFGVDISYAELDMPEFLGGCSEYVNINQINQTSAGTDDDPLGSYAGQGSVTGSSRHPINRYFDEHGYVIGIVSVVPVPTYTQVLPKHFTKFSTLDYFFPEFGHLGYQPITYNELCPLQAAEQNKLDTTFGYQRAWYDYLSALDEAHGDFRNTLRHFVLMRTFNNLPSLNPTFLEVHPEQMNEVFTVSGYDQLLGQLHFNCTMKRPIPRFGIPRLE